MGVDVYRDAVMTFMCQSYGFKKYHIGGASLSALPLK